MIDIMSGTDTDVSSKQKTGLQGRNRNGVSLVALAAAGRNLLGEDPQQAGGHGYPGSVGCGG